MSDPVTYTAVLPVTEETVLFVSALRAAERRGRGTRRGRRAGLLPAGGAGAALVSRRHPAGPAGRRPPDRPLDGLPLSARGDRHPPRGRTRSSPGPRPPPRGPPRAWGGPGGPPRPPATPP